MEQTVLTLAEAKIIAEVCDGDGHSILAPDAFKGVNEGFLQSVTQMHESHESDPKWQITNAGEPVDRVAGIYTLDILRAACRVLGLPNDAGVYYGRGRQARAYTDALLKAIAKGADSGSEAHPSPA